MDFSRFFSIIGLELGIYEQTFEDWTHKYGGKGVSDVKHLKQLEEKNGA